MGDAMGVKLSGEEYRYAAKNGEYNPNETSTFNKETGKWESNDKAETHVVINEDQIDMQTTSVQEMEGVSDQDIIDQEIDYETHNTEVHEGVHAVQDGYDSTIVDENGNDTGVVKPYKDRSAEKEAFAKGDNPEEELRNKNK
ncbi:hypothetical protein OM074_20375 [Marinilabiliaceae bacterium D04]|uniref:Uncharacterized protein n=2 Tax=Plebeiibacterium marinum TaxID=2992111 RepID=A0AAE3MIC5_9BACT|nr:hypothetical protein [Plebeiobacterium marinum]